MPVVNTDPKDLTNGYKGVVICAALIDTVFVCMSGCVYQPCCGFLPWESPGPNICKTLWGPTIAPTGTLTNTHTTITHEPTNNSICLPPDTASFVAALKRRDYFLYFQGNGFYISCVFVNQTSISKKAGGITLISLTVFVKAQQYRLHLLRFPTFLPWEHAFTVTAGTSPME